MLTIKISHATIKKLSKQISKLFFQLSTQEYSVPGQTERKRKTFLEWKSIHLPSNLLHVSVMLTIINVFTILFLLVGIGNTLAIFKTNQ